MEIPVHLRKNVQRVVLPPDEKRLTFLVPRGVRILSYPSFLIPDSSSPLSFSLQGDGGRRIFRGMVTLAWGKREKRLELILERENVCPACEGFHPVFPEHPFFPKSGLVLAAPGDYPLRERLVLTPPFQLVGMDGTLLFYQGEVLRIEGEGEGLVRKVTFRLWGGTCGNVAVVLRSRVIFEECVFQGGIREKLSWMGNGVVAAQGASLLFRRCVFLGNEASGILVEAGARVEVEDSVFMGNHGEGILARQGSTLVVRHSRFLRNAWGLTCGGLCLFEGNEVLENTTGGVCLLREAKGVFDGNRIAQNPVGVVWQKTGNVLWGEGNTLEGNRVPLLEE